MNFFSINCHPFKWEKILYCAAESVWLQDLVPFTVCVLEIRKYAFTCSSATLFECHIVHHHLSGWRNQAGNAYYMLQRSRWQHVHPYQLITLYVLICLFIPQIFLIHQNNTPKPDYPCSKTLKPHHKLYNILPLSKVHGKIYSKAIHTMSYTFSLVDTLWIALQTPAKVYTLMSN